MADIEQRLKELEAALDNTEHTPRQEKGAESSVIELPRCYNYFYIIAAAIPVITALVLYFSKPKLVLKKGSATKICMVALLKWVFVFTLLGWAILYGAHYFNLIPNALTCLKI